MWGCKAFLSVLFTSGSPLQLCSPSCGHTSAFLPLPRTPGFIYVPRAKRCALRARNVPTCTTFRSRGAPFGCMASSLNSCVLCLGPRDTNTGGCRNARGGGGEGVAFSLRWRADLMSYDDKGTCVLIDATAKCLGAPLGATERTKASLRDAEKDS